MNFTKGNWKIRPFGITSQIYVETPEKKRSKEYTIAERIYNKDNAHLLVAAPAMYKALKMAKQCLSKVDNFQGMQIIDAALAKAEGK